MSVHSYLQMPRKYEREAKVKIADVDRRIEQFKSAAREAGVKLTHQRLEIFREIASSLEHPGAEAVFRGVQPRMPTVSLDTVYRTLWMLHDLGMIARLSPGRESMRFDANLAHHHHYVCVRCGLVRDFADVDFDEAPIRNAVKSFGGVVDAHVEVRGICDECGKRAHK